jgi:hypothetical protein
MFGHKHTPRRVCEGVAARLELGGTRSVTRKQLTLFGTAGRFGSGHALYSISIFAVTHTPMMTNWQLRKYTRPRKHSVKDIGRKLAQLEKRRQERSAAYLAWTIYRRS